MQSEAAAIGTHPAVVDFEIASPCPPELLQRILQRLNADSCFMIAFRVGVVHEHPDAPLPMLSARSMMNTKFAAPRSGRNSRIV